MKVFFFCYHKVGTNLIAKVLDAVAPVLGWQVQGILGVATGIDESKDAVHFVHSRIGFDLSRYAHRGVRLVRDPRDVWLSGYLYHRRCTEAWCTNIDFGTAPPILFPRVPYSQEHRSEAWKAAYIEGLGGRSYRDNLMSLDRDAGLAFERERYADWTVSAMTTWAHDPDTIRVRIEDFMADFDGTLWTIFRHCQIPEDAIPALVAAASVADIGRMSDAALASDRHIHSRQISKWRAMLTPPEVEAFEDRHAEAILQLGYPLARDRDCTVAPGLRTA